MAGLTASDVAALVLAVMGGFAVGGCSSRLLLRHPGGDSPFSGWATCRECGSALPWSVLAPGAEWFGPVMPPCGHPLPHWRGWLLLAVMLASGGLAFVYGGEARLELGFGLLLLWLLVPLALVDLVKLEVELWLLVGGLALRLLGLSLWAPRELPVMIAGMLVGAGLFTMVDMIYRTVRNRIGLGEGDAAVLGLIGAFVGWQGVLPVVALSAVTGLTLGGSWLWWRRGTLATPIPYVPFLALAGMAVYLLRTVAGGNWWPLLGGLFPMAGG